MQTLSQWKNLEAQRSLSSVKNQRNLEFQHLLLEEAPKIYWMTLKEPLVRLLSLFLLKDFCPDDGVNVFKGMTKDPRFVPGAGAAEIELARRLSAFADSTPGLIQYAIKKYGEAFEVIPRTLAENCSGKTNEILAGLYAAHGKGQVNDGVDVEV